MAFMALMGGSLLTAVNHDNQLGDLLGGIPVVGQTLGDITNTSTSIFGGFQNGMMSMTGNLLGGLTGGLVGGGSSSGGTTAIIEDVMIIGGILAGIGVVYYVLK